MRPRKSEAMHCPDENRLVEYLGGPPDQSSDIATHLIVCEDCRKLGALLTGAETGRKRMATGSVAEQKVGRFEILETLGQGAMGIVYRAVDPDLEREVAIKLRRSASALSCDIEERLRREAQSLARLNHPNVVTVHETGEHRGRIYIAMELVDGITLADWLESGPGQGEIVEVFRQAGEGLSAAHEAGVIHRDFKPANVLVCDGPHAKVMDFGLARLDGELLVWGESAEPAESALDMSLTGGILGTPAYMAPEQIRGERGSAASDQFAFCVALFEALCGHRPHGGASREELLATMQAIRQEVESAAGLSRRLREVLSRGLALDPAERFASMADLVSALAPAPRASRLERWLLGAVGAVVLLSLAIIFLKPPAASTESSAGICSAEFNLDGIWDDQVRARLQPASNPVVLRQRSGELDRYAHRWLEARSQVCAAREAGVSPQRLRPKEDCLRARRAFMRATTGELQTDRVERRVSADLFPSIGDCLDDRAAALRAPMPGSAEKREVVSAVRDRLEEARSFQALGQHERARERLASLEGEAESLGFAPLTAEILYEQALNRRATEKTPEAASEALRAAERAAEASGHDRLAAEIWLAMADLAVIAGSDPERGREYAGYGRAVLDKLGGDPLLEIEWRRTMGTIAWRGGELDEALVHYQHAADLAEARGGRPRARIEALNGIGLIHTDQGRYDEALKVHEKVLELRQQYYGAHHGEIARSHTTLGNVYMRQGRYDAALEHYESALRLAEETYGQDHFIVAFAAHNLGGILSEMGRLDQAEAALRRAVEVFGEAYGADHPNVAKSRQSLGLVLLRENNVPAAIAELRQSLAGQRRAYGDEHVETAGSLMDLAMALRENDNLTEALELANKAVAIYEKHRGKESFDLAGALVTQGKSQLAMGRDRAAAASLKRSVSIYEQAASAPLDRLTEARHQLVLALWQGGRAKPALELAEQALSAARAGLGSDHSEVLALRKWLEARQRS
jgi:tetratricopeptide (TPR) repeat protein/tRNA A-37 threonylcarbamoyl transferase component Bud32